MSKLILQVRDNKLDAYVEGQITSDTVIEKFDISFDDSWTPYAKEILLYNNPRKIYRVIIETGGEYDVPSAAVSVGGRLYCGVIGTYTDGGIEYRKVTNVDAVPIVTGAYSDTNTPEPPTNSEYSQMLSLMQAYMNAQTLVISSQGYSYDSEAYAVGKRNGSDVPSGDPAYHNNAKYYASQYVGRHGSGEHAEIFNRYEDEFPDDCNRAIGDFSHAEGNGSSAYGDGSHAENGAEAYGNYSHAEGKATAGGFCSHAQGSSVTDGNYSHAGGYGTRANSDAGFAHGYEVQNSRFVAGNAIFGAFGQSAPDDMFAVAGGADIDHKKLLFEIKVTGDVVIAGANITQTASGGDTVITFA